MKRLSVLLLTVSSAVTCLSAQTISTGTITLEGCYALAAVHYQPLKLAQQEIDVSGWKLAEASRGLLPTVSVKAEETNGEADREVGTPNFKEQSIGIQANYALFEGGRSWFNRQQARLSYSVSSHKYVKAQQEMRYNVQEAYWNLMRVRENLDSYRASQSEIRHLYETSRTLYENGDIAERECLAVESQCNQADYQVDSAAADLENYSWKLADAVGVDKPLEGSPEGNIPFKEISIPIEECLAQAAKSSPDLAVQTEAAEAARYGAKIKQGYKWPRIDLNGFYGKSGGAYENEELKLGEDYQIGVQLTQFFLFNTLSGSCFSQKTSPKVGQSARTGVQTVSASMGLLDGYKQISEEKEAGFTSTQAQFGLIKTRSAVNQEVREAYFNYRKALAQVNNTSVDLSIAKKELEIDRINLGNDRSSIVSVAESMNKCAGAKAAYNEAKTFYLISLAALNKAIGVENKYTIEE